MKASFWAGKFMSASKSNHKENQDKELTGKVVLQKFGQGSKSEHDAVCLETDQGSFVLRRVGGNPFRDPVLHQLIGKTITATGMIRNYVFFAKEITESK